MGASALAADVPQRRQFEVAKAQDTLRWTATANADPTIVWEDVSEAGRPIPSVRIGELRLGKRILSGSRFELHAHKLGTWEYGFGMRAMPRNMTKDPRDQRQRFLDTTYPYCKRLHDPAEPFTSIRLYPAQMVMQFRYVRKRGVREIVYPLDFGPDLAAVGVEVYPSRVLKDGTGALGSVSWYQVKKGGSATLEAVVSRDAAGTDVIGRVANGTSGGARRLPGSLYVSLPSVSAFHVTLRMTEGQMVLLAGGGMKVFLRHIGKAWPTIRRGANELAYQESGPGGRRVVQLVAHDAVACPGFAGDGPPVALRGTHHVERVAPDAAPDAVVNGGRVFRVTAVPGKPSVAWYIDWPMPADMRDWRTLRAVRITYRVPTWCGRVQLAAMGVYGDKPRQRYVRLGSVPILHPQPSPAPAWRTSVKTLPADASNRGDVRWLRLQPWGPSWQRPAKDVGKGFCLEIGHLELLPFRTGEREAIASAQRQKKAWAEATKNSPILKRLQGMPLPSGPRIRPRDVFLRGMWGIPSRAAGMRGCDMKAAGFTDDWDFRVKLLDDFKAHHLNAVQPVLPYSYFGPGFDSFVKLAHEKGFLIWANSSPCISHTHVVRNRSKGNAAATAKEWERQMQTWEKLLTEWKDVPTIVAWEAAEEIGMDDLAMVLDARQRLARIGAQPQIMLYNKPPTLLADTAREPLPGGACMDSYVFLKLGILKHRYIAYLKTIWEGVKQCNGVGWITPQLIDHKLAPAYAELTLPAMRFQVWTAIAYNIKGIFPYYYPYAKNPDFTDKPFYAYYGDEMARLEAAEKLLVAMERDDDLVLLEPMHKDILVGSFRDRDDGAYQFVVLANTNLDTPIKAVLKPKHAGSALLEVDTHGGKIALRRIKPGGPIVLEPGDGTIVFVGTQDQAGTLKTRYW